MQETIYFDNVVAVLYRKDKEIPNNVIFFNFKGKQLYTINDIVKAKVQRGYDHIEKKMTLSSLLNVKLELYMKLM